MGLSKAYDELTDNPEFSDGLSLGDSINADGNSIQNSGAIFSAPTNGGTQEQWLVSFNSGTTDFEVRYANIPILRGTQNEEIQARNANSDIKDIITGDTSYDIQKNGTDGTNVINFKT